MKDGKLYKIEGNGVQSEQAYKSGLSFRGKPMDFELTMNGDTQFPMIDCIRHTSENDVNTVECGCLVMDAADVANVYVHLTLSGVRLLKQ